MVAVVSTWPGTFSNTLDQATPPPPASSCEIPVANTGHAGNWLFALVAWSSPAAPVSVAVGDDTLTNVWLPLGAPIASTPAGGNVRCAVWYCANPAAAGNVFVAPDGYCPAIAALIVEMSGLSPWATLAMLVPNYSNSGTALTVAAPAPAGQTLSFGLFAWSDHIQSATGGLANTLPQVTVTDTVDITNDLLLLPSWQATSSALTVSYSIPSISEPLAALLVGILVTGTPPVPAGPSYPYLQVNAAFNGGSNTPWDQLQWTDLTTRWTSLTTARGKQYELDTIQSGTGSWRWRNNDGALTPGNEASPYWLGVTAWSVLTGAGTLTPSPPPLNFCQGQPSAYFVSDGVTANQQFGTTMEPVTVGWVYTGVAQLLCPAGWSPGARLQIAWFNSGGGSISTSAGTVTPLAFGQWTQLFIQATAPAGTAFASLAVQVQGTPLISTRIWIAAAPLADPTGKIVNTNPYFVQGPQINTPIQLLGVWPAPPAASARWYSVHRGFGQRWPNDSSNARYQYTGGQTVDVWALTTALLPSMPRAEMLQDSPYAWWPLDDTAGSTTAANAAKTTAGALQVVTTKYGPGSSVQGFGADASALQGDPSTSAWQVQGQVSLTQGYSLYYTDPNLPGLGGTLTLEGWFNLATSQPTGNLALLTALSAPQSSAGANTVVVQVYCRSSDGALFAQAGPWPSGTTSGPFLLSAANWMIGQWFHLAVAASSSTVTVYVNGAQAGVTFSLPAPAAANLGWAVGAAGVASPWLTTGLCNCQVAHVAVYPTALQAPRVMTHYLSMLTAMAGYDLAGQRIERLLSAGNAAYPRCIPQGYDQIIGAIDVAGQSCGQNVVNVAESDGSLLAVNSAGYMFQIPRRAGFNLPTLWVFGENPAQPLNQNATFETGVAPWHATNGATAPVQSNTWAYSGVFSMMFTGNGTTANAEVSSERIPVTPGTTYTFMPWVFSPQGWATGATQVITWFNGSGTQISSTTQTPTPLTAGVPTQLSFTGRAPNTAATVQVSIRLSGTPASSVQLFADQAAWVTQYTEYPYLSSFATGYDPTQTYNDVQLQQVAAPQLLSYAFIATVNTDLFYAAGSSFSDGQTVTLTGSSLPSPFTTNVTYFIVNAAGPTFQLSTTVGGSPIAVTVSGSGTVSAMTSANGVTLTFASQSSIDTFNDQTLQQSTYLLDPDTVTDQGWWIVNTTNPLNRVPTLVIDPSANPALWPVVFGVETGQAVQVHRRLGGTQEQLGGIYQVMSVSHQSGPRKWQTTLGLVPYPGQVLTCDDPIRGVLDGDSVFGW